MTFLSGKKGEGSSAPLLLQEGLGVVEVVHG